MKLNNSVLKVAVITAALLCSSHNLNAAPLFDGSELYVDAGGAPDASGQCTVGSCFGMEVSPGFWIWTMVSPGNDGGFIVGKNQLSGGQETGSGDPSTTPGDISAAWFFFGGYGTFFADNALNTFSDTSNDGATVLNDYNVAWGGYVIPMAGAVAQGVMNDYMITLDGSGAGSWSMDYSAIVPEGAFIGVPFRMIVKGAVITAEPPCNCPPVVNNVSLITGSGETRVWIPDFSDTDPDATHTCTASSASNGSATVNSDCSSGTYTSGAGFNGIDSFTYTVTDQEGNSGTGTVNVNVCYDCGYCTSCTVCMENNPLRQITTVGGGQSPTVNSTVITTFTGHITTEAGLVSGGKNTVKICSGSTVDFTSDSTVGTATCAINSAVTASMGTLAIGDKLICTNKPDGSDTDRFTIKSGN